MSDKFNQWTDNDIADLIGAYPLACIIPLGDDNPAILHMPVLLEKDAEGKPMSLLGHLPRRSPLAKDWPMRAMFIFHGPSRYISPHMAGRSNWAPTWNFITVSVVANIHTDDHLTEVALAQMIAHMERSQSEPWSVEQLGERYESLKAAIIGFRARVDKVSARFKLGQDESTETFSQILANLDNEDLKSWMQRMAIER
jgi:transcriptional regulator